MKEKVELTIITVNYNGLEDTRDLICSILGLVFSFSFEIIVVDNASREDEASLLKEEFPSIITLRSENNLGFARANNLGIRHSSGDLLYFLNNDALLSEQGGREIEKMMQFLRENPTVGGLSPKIKYNEPKNMIQFAGSTQLSFITLRNYQIGYKEEDEDQYTTMRPIPYLHGAAMMVSRKVIEEMGEMPECYFLYYEEIDWSRTIRRKYKLYYFPQATVYHKESATTGVDSPLKAYFLTRNRLIYSFRHRQGQIRILSILYQISIAAPVHILRYLKSGKVMQALSVVRGIGSFGLFIIRKR
ncbi:MAG: hypothetical protein H6Q14_2357 [Bacteroidetes bacterium]|nr:hypothetical protein [Bacteroidota bacterium]